MDDAGLLIAIAAIAILGSTGAITAWCGHRTSQLYVFVVELFMRHRLGIKRSKEHADIVAVPFYGGFGLMFSLFLLLYTIEALASEKLPTVVMGTVAMGLVMHIFLTIPLSIVMVKTGRPKFLMPLRMRKSSRQEPRDNVYLSSAEVVAPANKACKTAACLQSAAIGV
ncbi:hypothetical protein [Haloglycomyces albus]|uniref:hypothetical protein n=1 Tax=Haloglycomyces albus TaxID=526067 RepID=UPI00054D4678|nr:hypothetical protein [Haloglycomyces albus]